MAGTGVEFTDLLRDAALPIVKVFILCFLGAVAAHANIFDPGARKNVSVLVMPPPSLPVQDSYSACRLLFVPALSLPAPIASRNES